MITAVNYNIFSIAEASQACNAGCKFAGITVAAVAVNHCALMKWKPVFVAPVLLLVALFAYSGAVAIGVPAGLVPVSGGPAIESILHNPAVQKKQVSRNQVQAIGRQPGGTPQFIIHFRKEELHGDWQSFYGNNQPCDSGSFYRNLPTGEWKTWYPNGRLKTVRTYDAEKQLYIKADLKRNHPKEQRYVITRQGRRNATRHFKPQYEGAVGMNQGLPMLQKIQHNTAGNAYLPPFADCLHHGLFINYDEQGRVKDSGHYKNGLKEGLWHETGAEKSLQAFGFYRQGLRHGQWKYYDGDGRLVYTEWFNRNGKRSEWHHFNK